MDEEFVKVNVNSIVEFEREYDTHSKNILNILSSILNEFNNMDEIIHTKTSVEYKNRVVRALNKTIDSIDKSRLYFNSNFDNISNLYVELYDDIKASINTNDKMEV